MRQSTTEIMRRAWQEGIVVPAFNIPHLPMMETIVRVLRDTNTFGLIQVARLEWEKFEAQSLQAVRDVYQEVGDDRVTRLHLDHVPVIDEDDLRVDFGAILGEAVELGYESLMVDGSRLPLEENIACSAEAAAIAHAANVPLEAELGAVLGHEAGPLPPYEELFNSGQGFTDPNEAARFVTNSGVDWLSVAIGNIHGAISGAAKSEKKVQAKLNIEHLDCIRARLGIPLVLYGGSGIRRESLQQAFKHGIAKINIGTALRQAYEQGLTDGAEAAAAAVAEEMLDLIRVELNIEGSARTLEISG